MNKPAWIVAGLWLLAAQATALAHSQKAHEHGAVKLDVAVDGARLQLTMEAPLDNLLGFERAPRNDAERKAAADVLARLRAPAGLFNADAAAQCTLSSAEVKAPVLEPGAKDSKDGHADLDASYTFQCAQPGALRSLDIGLFDAYRRIQRIDVQLAGAKSQAKLTLRRPARTVKLAP
jgi:hypothetical protein